MSESEDTTAILSWSSERAELSLCFWSTSTSNELANVNLCLSSDVAASLLEKTLCPPPAVLLATGVWGELRMLLTFEVFSLDILEHPLEVELDLLSKGPSAVFGSAAEHGRGDLLPRLGKFRPDVSIFDDKVEPGEDGGNNKCREVCEPWTEFPVNDDDDDAVLMRDDADA